MADVDVMLTPVLDDELRDTAAEALAAVFAGPPAQRIADARAVADIIEQWLRAMDDGQISGSMRERARLEGAVIALRAISGSGRG